MASTSSPRRVRAERRQLGRLADLARPGDGGEAAAALLVLVVERLGDGEEFVVLPLQIVPRAEPALLALVEILGQRVVAEEVAQAHDRLVDRRDVGALADEDEVGVAEGEDLPVHLLDEEFEGVDRFVLAGKDNERTLNYLPIQNIAELSQPGLYFAVMKRAGTFDKRIRDEFLLRQRHRPAHARVQRSRCSCTRRR